MNGNGPYVMDADLFITAKNRYYSFEICPGFWDCILGLHHTGTVCSIDKVRSELLAGREDEDLVQWVKGKLPAEFFRATDAADVLAAYTQVMLWVQRSTQYQDHAKAKFATEADGWLVAYGMVNSTVVITNEQPQPQSKVRVLLPDVCAQFGVQYADTFWMLHDRRVRFELVREAPA